MALFDVGSPQTLEDVLGRQAETQGMATTDAYAKKRKRLIDQQAASGRLSSGVANYSLADADAEEIGALGDIEKSLADVLGQIPTEDFVRQNEFQRQEELAQLIARMNKKSRLSGILGGVGSGAATGAAVGGPWGAVAGGALGGILGSQG